jgi:NAD(P)-dependent dehydrogenase (short-subunit alcohol dehydrogenase family)
VGASARTGAARPLRSRPLLRTRWDEGHAPGREPRLARLADAALELSVVGGFSRLGFAVRRGLFGWDRDQPAVPPGLAVVTGGSSGIGQAAAEALVRRGWSVTIVSRDRARSAAALARLEQIAPTAAPPEAAPVVRAETADLADLAQTRQLAATLAARGGALDVLVHAAGVMFRDFHRTEQGFEATFALHVLAPHLLTSLLLPSLQAAAGRPARVITVSSGGMYAARLDLAALEHANPAIYHPARQYALAKRAQVELAPVWAERLRGRGVVPLVVHPGWVDTAALAHGLPAFTALVRPLLRTPAEGADTIVDLALRGDVEQHGGELFFDRRPRARSPLPGTAATPAQRRAACERVSELTGALPPSPAV